VFENNGGMAIVLSTIAGFLGKWVHITIYILRNSYLILLRQQKNLTEMHQFFDLL
jgi:hypothetical protein